MLLERKGNLFDFKHEAYAHGVNTLGIMNAGIAVEFKTRYSKMFSEYQQLCEKKQLQLGDVFMYTSPSGQKIFNLATQELLSQASFMALENSMNKMYDLSIQHDIKDIAMPLIGVGRGNLSKDHLTMALLPFVRSSRRQVTLYELP